MRRLAYLCGTLALATGHAFAQDLPGDPAAGARLAQQVCAVCHLVSDDQRSDPETWRPADGRATGF